MFHRLSRIEVRTPSKLSGAGAAREDLRVLPAFGTRSACVGGCCGRRAWAPVAGCVGCGRAWASCCGRAFASCWAVGDCLGRPQGAASFCHLERVRGRLLRACVGACCGRACCGRAWAQRSGRRRACVGACCGRAWVACGRASCCVRAFASCWALQAAGAALHGCRTSGRVCAHVFAPRRTPVNYPGAPNAVAGGHTASNAPDLFRPPKLSGAGPG